MINQCFRTHFLKFHVEFCTLINENFNQTPNLVSILFKIPYVIFSLLQFNNGTNSNHMVKYSLTKTY